MFNSHKIDSPLNTESLSTVDSPWHVPLPWEEHTPIRVAVYFYSNGWIPITFYPLVDAIKLHHKGLSSGMDIAVFPPNLDPRSFDISLTEVHPTTAPQPENAQVLTDKQFKLRDQQLAHS